MIHIYNRPKFPIELQIIESIPMALGPWFIISLEELIHQKYTMSIPSNLSKEFVDFVKAIGDSKTKQDEDLIVVREMAFLKKTIMDNKSSDVWILDGL